MTEPGGTARRTWDWDDLASAAGTATVVAGILYGYGWLLLTQFYAYFDVAPEEVGVTFAFITVRIALLFAVFGLVVVTAYLMLRAAGRVRWRPERSRPAADPSDSAYVRLRRWVDTAGTFEQAKAAGVVFLVASVGLGGLAALLGSAFGIDIEAPEHQTIGGLFGAAVLSAPLWVFATALGATYAWDRWRPRVLRGRLPDVVSLRRPARVLTVVLAVGVAATVLAPIWWAPRLMADVVRGPDPAATVPGLSLIGLRVDSVRVSTVMTPSDAMSLLVGRCVRLLGSAAGTTVLYDPGTQLLVRLPTESVVLVRPCR